jgi:tripartite-type tricarboxylate transporter receptor subunit TctC
MKVRTKMPASRHRLSALIGSVIGFLATIISGSSIAQTSKRAVADKSVNLIVGMPPGGSVDVYARLVQRHLGRFLPGTPAIIVQNKPGAGSLLSVMAVANRPPSDGLTLGTFSSSLIPNTIAQPEHFRVDFRHFSFIGKVGVDYRVCYVRGETGIHNLKELAEHNEITFAATASGTSGNLNLAILKDLFKVKLKLKEVLGYPGSAAKRLAFERGEVDGDCGSADSIPEQWLTERKINMLVRFLPELLAPVDQSVPFAGDLLNDDADRQLFDFLTTPGRMLGTFLVSDKVAKEAVDELRRAFDAMVLDPVFLSDARQIGFPVSPMSGAELEQEIARLYATPPRILQRAKALLEE